MSYKPTYFNDKIRFYSGVPKKYATVFLPEVELKNDEQATFKEKLEHLLKKDAWAVTVLGTVGNGKTTLSCSAVNYWNDLGDFYDDPAYYTTQESLCSEFKDTYSGNGSEFNVYFKYTQKAKLLVIDELNPGDWSAYNKNLIQKILVQRYANDLLTILIGNLNADQLKEMFDAHIISRLREGMTLYMTAPDMRERSEL